MRLPRIVPLHPGQAAGRELAPLAGIAQHLQQCLGDVLRVQRIHQVAVAAVGGDIPRSAVLRGNDRQAARRGLDQRQAERFGERRVDENPLGGSRQPVEHGDILGPVRLRIGHPAVEVVLVNAQQDIGQHLLDLVVHIPDVLAVAGDDHQVGRLLQGVGFAVGLQQRGDVLAGIRARQRQYDRAVGIDQETTQFAVDRGVTLAAIGRKKIRQLGAGRNDPHLLRLVMIVETVLLFDLLVGAGDHQFGRAKDILLGLDTTRHVVTCLYIVALQAARQQPPALDSTERVPGMHQWHPELAGKPDTDIARIGIMTVDDIGHQLMFAQPVQGIISKHIEAVP